MFIIGMLFVILGLSMIIVPQKTWTLWETCKYQCKSELSKGYLLYIRISGIIITAIGIALIL